MSLPSISMIFWNSSSEASVIGANDDRVPPSTFADFLCFGLFERS